MRSHSHSSFRTQPEYSLQAAAKILIYQVREQHVANCVKLRSDVCIYACTMNSSIVAVSTG